MCSYGFYSDGNARGCPQEEGWKARRRRESPCDRPPLFNVRDRRLPFSVLNLIPLQRELGLVQPKLMLGQLFDFPLGIDAGNLFNLPYPIQTKGDLRDPGLSSRNLLFPLSVRFFAAVQPGALC
jgi:hypothetical protein